MSQEFKARLWKIGSSVVFTLPSHLVPLFTGYFAQVNSVIDGKNIGFMMQPWKCGGSFVITVPKQYVEAYDLGKIVRNKDEISLSIEKV
jgi:hypothetical protein